MPWRNDFYLASMTRDEHGSMMWMDSVHVAAIYDLCMSCRFDEAMEIGCWDGFSTSAIVQANRDGCNTALMCVDVDIRPQLLNVLQLSTAPWSVCKYPSVAALSRCRSKQLCLVDGDHSIETCRAELGILLDKKWPTLIYHDCGKARGCEGPRWVRESLEASGAWHVFVDEVIRPGMMTERGLMLATTEVRVAEAGKAIWERMAKVH